MRRLRRAGALALILLFGVPAAALLLGRFGIIALPQDAYVRPEPETSPAISHDDRARVLERLNTLETPRAVVAHAAIRAAAAYLPGHEAGVDRDWAFYRVSGSGPSYGRTIDALASARIVCDACSGAPARRVMISARVDRLGSDRAEVIVAWGPGPEYRRPYEGSGAADTISAAERGKVRIALVFASGEWHARRIEPLP